MLAEFVYLWKNREQPSKLKRWLVIWVKRGLQFLPLVQILVRQQLLRLKGARIGKLAILGKAKFQGRYTNLQIGDQVSLGRCEIALHEQVSIGRCAIINDGVFLLTASHDISDPQWREKSKHIVIGDYAWIATNSIILPGVTIGRGAVIGAGTVVRESIPDYAVVIGNPSVITNIERTRELNYSPVLFNAPFEAWIGRNIHHIEKDNQ